MFPILVTVNVQLLRREEHWVEAELFHAVVVHRVLAVSSTASGSLSG
jgi:hypothetical protein